MEFFKAWMTRSNPAEPLEQAVRKWKALLKGFWCARLQHLLLKPLQSQASCTSFLICKLLTSESTGSCMEGPQTSQRTGTRLRTLTQAQFPALLQTNGQNSLSKIQKAEEGVNTACISHFSCRLFCAKTKHCGWGLGLLTSGPWRAHLVFRHLGWLVWVSNLLSPARDSKNSFRHTRPCMAPKFSSFTKQPLETHCRSHCSSPPKWGTHRSCGDISSQRLGSTIPALCHWHRSVRSIIISSAILIHFPGKHQCKLCQALQMFQHEREKNQFFLLLFPIYLFLCFTNWLKRN